MEQQQLIPHLFRTEYRKIIAVLCKLFGIEHIEIAEDIASDTFLLAAELWGQKGLPENPTAWLYTVAKNKTKDYFKHNSVFAQKVSRHVSANTIIAEELTIDLSLKNINDSQLAMIFAICDSCISPEAQIGLALNLLCGFGIDEVARAFLTNKEVIYKRLQRAKEKLRIQNVPIEPPSLEAINNRLPNVLTSLYLLFNEGYYSSSPNTTLRKELCLEAMRLNYLLVENELTNTPSANALLSLMCFHSSRFQARINLKGEIILYDNQDEQLWDNELITKGEYYLNKASQGKQVTKYHLEAAMAYWHTNKKDTEEKWENILQLYNKLLQLEYSPIAALNRTYALAKANGKATAITEALKLNLDDNHLYHALLGNLYTTVDNAMALQHFEKALQLAKSNADKVVIANNIERLKETL